MYLRKWLCKREKRKEKGGLSIFLFRCSDGQRKWEMTHPTSSLLPTSLKTKQPHQQIEISIAFQVFNVPTQKNLQCYENLIIHDWLRTFHHIHWRWNPRTIGHEKRGLGFVGKSKEREGTWLLWQNKNHGLKYLLILIYIGNIISSFELSNNILTLYYQPVLEPMLTTYIDNIDTKTVPIQIPKLRF